MDRLAVAGGAEVAETGGAGGEHASVDGNLVVAESGVVVEQVVE